MRSSQTVPAKPAPPPAHPFHFTNNVKQLGNVFAERFGPVCVARGGLYVRGSDRVNRFFESFSTRCKPVPNLWHHPADPPSCLGFQSRSRRRSNHLRTSVLRRCANRQGHDRPSKTVPPDLAAPTGSDPWRACPRGGPDEGCDIEPDPAPCKGFFAPHSKKTESGCGFQPFRLRGRSIGLQNLGHARRILASEICLYLVIKSP